MYDIHSPRVPREEVVELLGSALRGAARGAVVGQPRLRPEDPHLREVEAALTNVVAAARRLRETAALTTPLK